MAALVGLSVPAAAALPTQSWNGYRWARTGPLSIAVGNNVSSVWKPYVTTAAAQWSAASNIDFVSTIGATIAPACNAVYGSVQVCSGNYGANGWLGYATVWLGGGFISQATVKLNDYYFLNAKYNTPDWRSFTACQELGHALGLAHNDEIRTNLNKGTCMDYTNDPSGKLNLGNGPLANIAPGAADFAALDGIYAKLDSRQLAQTKPQFRISDGLFIGEVHEHVLQAVPEPDTWLLMLAGFGAVGTSMRRQSSRRRARPAPAAMPAAMPAAVG